MIISIDENIVKIHNNTDIKLLGKDLIDIVLEVCSTSINPKDITWYSK